MSFYISISPKKAMIKNNFYSGNLIHKGTFFDDIEYAAKRTLIETHATKSCFFPETRMWEFVVQRNNYDIQFWVDEDKGEVISEKIDMVFANDLNVKFSTPYSYEKVTSNISKVDCIYEYGEEDERAVFYKNNILFGYSFIDWDIYPEWLLSFEGKAIGKKKLGSWQLGAIRTCGPEDKKFLLDAKFKELG